MCHSAQKTGWIHLLTLAVGVTSGLRAGAQDKVAVSLTAEQEKLFGILDTFDPVDTRKLRFVEFTTGRWSRTFKGHIQADSVHHGFLIENDGRRFTIRHLNWRLEELDHTKSNAPKHERVEFKPMSLRKFAWDIVSRISAANEDDPEHERHDLYAPYERAPGVRMNPTAQAIAIARACARRGWSLEVKSLWRMLPRNVSRMKSPMMKLGNAMHWQIVGDFSKRNSSWKDIHSRHVAWLAAFPVHFFSRSVRKRLVILKEMMTEKPGSNSDGAQARIARLIYELRNDFLPVVDSYFKNRLFPSIAPKSKFIPPIGPVSKQESRAAKELLEIGTAAIPALLDVVDDKALTRTVAYNPGWGDRFVVRTVGQKACDLIREITGESFELPTARAEVMAWYEKQKKKR